MFERLRNFFRKDYGLPNNLPQKSLNPKLSPKITEAIKLIRRDEENAWRIDFSTPGFVQNPSDREASLKWSQAIDAGNKFYKRTISTRVKLIFDPEVSSHLRARLDQPLKINTIPYLYQEADYGTQTFNLERDDEFPQYLFDQNNIPDLKN